MDLWSHVSTSTLVVLQVLDVLVSWEAKVEESDVHIIVYKDIFRLQIPMNYALVMHMLNSVKNLVHKKTRVILNHAISIIHHLLEVE